MQQPTKICTKCKEVNPVCGFFKGEAQCKVCCNDRQREYRRRNPEKMRAQYRKNYYKNHEKEKHESKVYSKKQSMFFTDSYVIEKLKKQGFKKEFIKENPSLLQIKRIQLKFKRSLKNKKSCQKL